MHAMREISKDSWCALPRETIIIQVRFHLRIHQDRDAAVYASCRQEDCVLKTTLGVFTKALFVSLSSATYARDIPHPVEIREGTYHSATGSYA